jgi:DNA-binding MarR family transcriptional regulator
VSELPRQVNPSSGSRDYADPVSADPEWLDEQQQAAWQSLLTVVIALPTLLDRQLERDEGMSNFEYQVLARLSLADGHAMRLSTLATQCNSTQPRLSKVMTRFEARGWTERSTDPANGRYTIAQLTAVGLQKIVETAPGHVAEVRRLVFDPLTPQQQRQLATSLDLIAATVRAELDAH